MKVTMTADSCPLHSDTASCCVYQNVFKGYAVSCVKTETSKIKLLDYANQCSSFDINELQFLVQTLDGIDGYHVVAHE